MSKKVSHPGFNRVIVVTGAGLSASAGIPTYRSEEGTWSKYDMNVVCNYVNWKKNREKVFEFFVAAQQSMLAAEPSPAHSLIAKWLATYDAGRVWHFSQNVDDLQRQALVARNAPEHAYAHYVKVHGDIRNLQCTACGHVWEATYAVDTRCPECDSLKGVKPGVVFFNELAPGYAKLHKMVSSLRPRDMLIFIGTAFEVLPLDLFLIHRAEALWPYIINVNPVKHEHPAIANHIEQPIQDILPVLDNLVQGWLTEINKPVS